MNQRAAQAEDLTPPQFAGDPVFKRDRTFYRTVIWFLGITAVLSVLGGVEAYIQTREAPDGIIAIGSAAVGALAGVFTGSKA